jgi:hypothetical protein
MYDIEKFNLKKLNMMEGKEQYQVKISNRFTALERLHNDMDINNAWETIRQNITLSAKESLRYYELMQDKIWTDEGCSKVLDQRK